MMVIPHSPLKLVGLSQGAANSVQAIVNLQFRKEHRALLSLFEDLKTRVEKSSADAERRVEESQKQLEETENRLKKLENEFRDLMQKNGEWEDQVKDLKTKMKKLGELMEAGAHATSASHYHDSLHDTGPQYSRLLRITPSPHGLLYDQKDQQSQLPPFTASPAHKRTNVANLQNELASTVASSHSSFADNHMHSSKLVYNITPSQADLDMPAVGQRLLGSIAMEPQVFSRSASTLFPVSNKTPEDPDYHPLNRHELNQLMPSSLAYVNKTSPPPPSPLATTQVVERLQSLSGKPSRKATSRKVVSPPPWVNISQARDQNVETYLSYAAEYIGAIKQRKEQFEFIARFIRGLLNEKDRDTLLKQLQKKFSSRTTKDGFVEVMCGFADVGDALVAVGLLGNRNGKRDGDCEINAAQKKRKTLESQLSEEYDDEL